MVPSSLQCIGNPHTQTNIFTGTVTTASVPNIVCSTTSHTGPALSVQTRSYLDKNNNTLGLASTVVTTPNRSSTDCKQKWTFNLSLQECNTNTNMCKDKDNKTNIIYMVIPYSKGLSESFRNICNKVAVQVHLMGATPSWIC